MGLGPHQLASQSSGWKGHDTYLAVTDNEVCKTLPGPREEVLVEGRLVTVRTPLPLGPKLLEDNHSDTEQRAYCAPRAQGHS